MKLLPCPFCGSEDISTQTIEMNFGAYGTTQCNTCVAAGPEVKLIRGASHDDLDLLAAEKWNTRAQPKETT